MPKFVRARPPLDDSEARKIRRLAGARHAPADWSERARIVGIAVGRSQVRRILRAEKVRWRRTRSWATSTGPEFAPKGPASWSSPPPRRPAPR